ncbi:arylsulfatase, partial [Rahnella sp. FRB 231]|nr:arylsulfatase [Rahnella ecdela]
MVDKVSFRRTMVASMLALISSAAAAADPQPAAGSPENAPKQDSSKPNIVVIFGDDIGYWNLSTYNQGMLGYKT